MTHFSNLSTFGIFYFIEIIISISFYWNYYPIIHTFAEKFMCEIFFFLGKSPISGIIQYKSINYSK